MKGEYSITGKPVEQVYHRLGSGETLLCRLENQLQCSRYLPGLRQIVGRVLLHGGMPVLVTACICRRELTPSGNSQTLRGLAYPGL
ncbi:hypothetical protein D3C80_1254790 [compost metagenome]